MGSGNGQTLWFSCCERNLAQGSYCPQTMGLAKTHKGSGPKLGDLIYLDHLLLSVLNLTLSLACPEPYSAILLVPPIPDDPGWRGAWRSSQSVSKGLYCIMCLMSQPTLKAAEWRGCQWPLSSEAELWGQPCCLMAQEAPAWAKYEEVWQAEGRCNSCSLV